MQNFKKVISFAGFWTNSRLTQILLSPGNDNYKQPEKIRRSYASLNHAESGKN